jgi:putative ABC transport system substrate-binding protein
LALLGGAAIARPLAAPAQPAERTKRVGLLFPGVLGERRLSLIRQGIDAVPQERGITVQVEARSAEGDVERLKSFADAFARMPADVILALGSASLHAAYAATRTVPIVALDLETDPIASGMVASLARPGGNVTGIFFDAPEVAGKWVQLLKDVVPRLATVGLLFDAHTDQAQLEAGEQAARSLGLGTLRFGVAHPDDLPGALRQAAEARADAVLIHSSPIFVDNAKLIAELTLQHRLPSVALFPVSAKLGGLLSYGPDNFALLPQAGMIVGKVLRGAAPADFPIERPTRFSLVVNVRTANRLGLTIPPALLDVADEVIE